jgi:hypothetical protein
MKGECPASSSKTSTWCCSAVRTCQPKSSAASRVVAITTSSGAERARERGDACLAAQLRECPIGLVACAVWIHASRGGRCIWPVRAAGLVAQEAAEVVGEGVLEGMLDGEQRGEVDVAGSFDVDDRLGAERMPDDDGIAAVTEERRIVELCL